MLEVRLRSGTVVAFDGRVLEIFEGTGGSRRLHVTSLPTPRLLEDPDGAMSIVLGESSLQLQLTACEKPACTRLIAAIEQALAAETELRSLSPD
jgi:hypothetical protein